jgi:hypothetical protein
MMPTFYLSCCRIHCVTLLVIVQIRPLTTFLPLPQCPPFPHCFGHTHDIWLQPAPLETHTLSADSLDIVVTANTIQGNAMASGSSLTSILMHSPSHSTISTTPYLDSIIAGPAHIPQAPETSVSFSTISSLSVLPQDTTTWDQHATIVTRTAGMHEDSQDPNPPLSMEAFPHLDQSAPRTPDCVKDPVT